MRSAGACWTLRKLEELRHSANQLRQDAITAELLDLIIGTQASDH